MNDEETLPWRLQRRFPEVEIVNFGVGGYGTLQSLIQLELEFARGGRRVPRLVVLNYGSYHDERNVLSPGRRRNLGMVWVAWGEREQPFAVLSAQGELTRHKSAVTYRPTFPFIHRSALMNALESSLVDRREREAAASDRRREISERLVQEMDALARKNGTRLLVIQTISPGERPEMVHFCQRRGILAFPLGLTGKGASDPSMSSLPFDGHPSAKWHALAVEVLVPVLKQALTTAPR